MSETVDDVLSGREGTYGPFTGHAEIAQALKDEMWRAGNWENLDADMKEALEMIQHKIARILNGDPRYTDNWLDIAGYARLVEARILEEDRSPPGGSLASKMGSQA